MALIDCADCNKKISDRAPSCPGCGCPVASPTSKSDGGYVTTQGTGKRYKGMQMIGAVVLAVGFGALVSADDSDTLIAAGALSVLIGLLMYGFGRALAWWHHS